MEKSVLIPYLQGSLFRPKVSMKEAQKEGLNPLSTGKSVQTLSYLHHELLVGLNPLSTGKSVQTQAVALIVLQYLS